jgi:hypothetical protein
MVSHGLTTPLGVTATFYDGTAVVGSTSVMVASSTEQFLAGSTSDQKFTSVVINASEKVRGAVAQARPR